MRFGFEPGTQGGKTRTNTLDYGHLLPISCKYRFIAEQLSERNFYDCCCCCCCCCVDGRTDECEEEFVGMRNLLLPHLSGNPILAKNYFFILAYF